MLLLMVSENKLKDAIFELYFRFWLWSIYHYWHVILHPPTIYHPIVTCVSAFFVFNYFM